MKNTIYISIFSLFASTLFLQAQEVKPISKVEVLTRVSEKNTTIKISEEEFKAAKADYERILKFNPDYENAKIGLERIAQATK